MFYLTTGANGACKTLMTLYDVRQQQVREHRPVYYHGFTPNKEVLEGEFGWKPHDPEKWNLPEDQGGVPDGSILIWDECQTYLGNKRWGNREPPKWVMDLGVDRRKRGIDIWANCPHPGSLHVEVRRLIADPSWHRHFKRIFGSDAANEHRFNTVNLKPEDETSEESETRMRLFPREVFGWYMSAKLHTAKRRVPRKVWVALACAVLVPAMGYMAWRTLRASVVKEPKVAAVPGRTAGQGAVGAVDSQAKGDKPPMTAAEYVAARTARVPGLSYTAPAYDEVTRPTVAPYPAACVLHQGSGRCECFTQQATKLEVPVALCAQIARGGVFMDWRQDVAQAQAVAPQPVRPDGAGAAAFVQAPEPVAAKGAVDLVNNGRESRLLAVGSTESGVFHLPVPSAREGADAAVFKAMRTGDWARH